MVGALVGISAFMVSLALTLYFGVIAFQVLILAAGTMAAGAARRNACFPALFQNIGIACGLAGGVLRDTDLLVFAALLIALALLVKTQSSLELHPRVETVLLLLGLVGFSSLGLVYAIV